MISEAALTFEERAPAEAASSTSPALILLHGSAMFRGHLFGLTTDFDPRLRVISAQAPIRIGPASYRWFEFERTASTGPIINDVEEESSTERLFTFVGNFIRERRPRAVYLLGHSQGGTMALTLALRHTAWFAGCANVNGRLLRKRLGEAKPGHPLTELSFFCGHGTHNDIVPLNLGRWTRDQIERLGGIVTYREYPIGHEISNEAMTDVSSWLTGHLNRTVG